VHIRKTGNDELSACVYSETSRWNLDPASWSNLRNTGTVDPDCGIPDGGPSRSIDHGDSCYELNVRLAHYELRRKQDYKRSDEELLHRQKLTHKLFGGWFFKTGT
jgi:hypothetical protein